MKMQVSGVGVVNDAVDFPMESTFDKSLNSSRCAASKNAFLCTFDWSHMFEVEEKLLEIAHVYHKLAQGSHKVDELIKAAVGLCGSDITISWSSFGIPEIGVTCTILIDSVQVAQADGKSFERAEKAAFSKAASVLSQPYLEVMREPCLIASDKLIGKGTFPDDMFSSSNIYRAMWRSQRKVKNCINAENESLHILDPSVEYPRGSDYIKTKAQSELIFTSAQSPVIDTEKTGEKLFSLQTETSALLGRDYEKSVPVEPEMCEVQLYQRETLEEKQKMSLSAELLSTEFVILRQLFGGVETPACEVLVASANFCSKEVNYWEESISSVCFSCTITLDALVIGCAFAESATAARIAAINGTVTLLEANCYTLLVKDLKFGGVVKNMITPEQLIEEDGNSNWYSNRGNPLGLGAGDCVPNLPDVLRQLMTEYLRHPQQEDLVFSPQFSLEIQAMICKEAATHDLIVSLCDGESQSECYIVLSRRRSIAQLVEHIRANGGETQKYVLIEPKYIADDCSHLKQTSSSDYTAGLSTSMASFSTDESLERQQDYYYVPEPNPDEQSNDKPSTQLIAATKSSVATDKPLVALGSTDGCESKDAVKSTEFDKLAVTVAVSGLSLGNSYKDCIEKLKQMIKCVDRPRFYFDPSAYVIVKFQSENLVLTLNCSSKLCGIKFLYEFEFSGDKKSVSCSMNMAGKVISEATGRNKFASCGSAAIKALSYLSQVCPTIILKNWSTCQEIRAVITPAQLMPDLSERTQAGCEVRFPKTNLLAGIDGDEFSRKQLDRVFMNYCKTKHHEDLIFSPSFTPSDRAYIKVEGGKWDLNWFSSDAGSEQHQFFVLSIHRTPLELVQFVRANGGETIRFKLVEATDPPTIVPPASAEDASDEAPPTSDDDDEISSDAETPPASTPRQAESTIKTVASLPSSITFEKQQTSGVLDHSQKEPLKNPPTTSFLVTSPTSSNTSCFSSQLVEVGSSTNSTFGGISSGPLYDEYVTSLKKFIKCVTEMQSSISFDQSAFLIIRHQPFRHLSLGFVLDSSAELCGQRVDYEESDEDLWFKCSIKLAGKEVSEVSCPSKFNARDRAAGRALGYLSQDCPTIIIKDLSKNCEIEGVITPAQIARDFGGVDENQHLDSEANPIVRNGLLRALDQYFSQYCKKPHHEDLIFSPKFSKSERNVINNEGQKWGLRWSNFGSGDFKQDQLIALSIYRTPLELVDFIRANGGETIRYQLVEATNSPKRALSEVVESKEESNVDTTMDNPSSSSVSSMSDSPRMHPLIPFAGNQNAKKPLEDLSSSSSSSVVSTSSSKCSLSTVNMTDAGEDVQLYVDGRLETSSKCSLSTVNMADAGEDAQLKVDGRLEASTKNSLSTVNMADAGDEIQLDVDGRLEASSKCSLSTVNMADAGEDVQLDVDGRLEASTQLVEVEVLAVSED